MKIEKKISDLANRVEKLESETKEEGSWKTRRKIIEEKEWRKIAMRDPEEAIAFLPDTHIGHPLEFYQDANDPRNLRIDGWYSDYYAMLIEKKDAKLGRSMCKQCILSPDQPNDRAGLRKMILKKLGSSNPKMACLCNVVDAFRCPLSEQIAKNDEQNPIHWGRPWILLSKMLLQAEYSTCHNDSIWRADFDTGKIIWDSPCGRGTFPAESLDWAFNLIKPSNVPIRSKEDVYNVLADNSMLQKLFDQFMDAKETKFKIEVIEMVRKLRSDVLPEALQILRNLQINDDAGTLLELPIFSGKMNHIVCHECGEFANIQCVKCQIWICLAHWSGHKQNHHNRKNETR